MLHKRSRTRMDRGSLIYPVQVCTNKLGTHLHRHSHKQWTESKRATCSPTMGVLHLFLSTSPQPHPPLPHLPSSFFPLVSLRIKHFTTALPFCQNTIFSCYLSYFCYKTCTGCLEQQQKYNIQFICNFSFVLIIINSFR